MLSDEAPKPICSRPAYVFFVAHGDRRLGWQRRYRIAKRFPARTYQWILGWLTAVVSRTNLCHVTIGHNGVVLDPSLGGNRFWPLCDFIEHYPNLAVMVIVPFTRDIDLAAWEQANPRPLRPFPSLIRLITRGRTPATNCVSIVADCLRCGGVETPRRIVTPHQLREHLERQPGSVSSAIG